MRLLSAKRFRRRFSHLPFGYEILATSAYFNEVWYRQQYLRNGMNKGTDSITHYLTEGWQQGCHPSPLFDDDLYLTLNPDVRNFGKAPLLHYEMHGIAEGRRISENKSPKPQLTLMETIPYGLLKLLRSCRLLSENKFVQCCRRFRDADYRLLYNSSLFDKNFYAQAYNGCGDPIDHYLRIGHKVGFNPSGFFDNDFYLARHTDILKAELNPLLHYERNGRKEGRDISKVLFPGVDFSRIAGTGDILLFSHELSRTGAPIALLNMAETLKKLHLSPFVLSPRHGALETTLKKLDIPFIVDPHLPVKLHRHDKGVHDFLSSFPTIFFNTIDTLRYVKYIKSTSHMIAWIHEGQYGFDCAAETIDIAQAFERLEMIYSVGTYAKSFTDRYVPSNKSGILLYGVKEYKPKPITRSEKLVFSIFGTCSKRKGTDYFVEAIRQMPKNIREDCEFRVIGCMSNSAFCHSLKERAQGLNIRFLGELSHDETLREMSLSDIVVCPSRDDPMPIVCTEAMQLGKVVVCSTHSGTADFVQNGINGFTCTPENGNLAEILIHLHHVRDKLATIGQNAYATYKEKFTEEVFEANLRSIITRTQST